MQREKNWLLALGALGLIAAPKLVHAQETPEAKPTPTAMETPTATETPVPPMSPAPTEAPTVTPAETSSAEATPDADEKEIVIVVTPTRNPRTLAETTSAVTVITRRQIEAKKPFDILDVLRQTPSLTIAQNGTRGKVASIFLRGTNSNQTLVMIDGVRANSPQDGRFDFGNIPTDNIERIEVLRGPQSALYGSDAIGGVINIITRRGEGDFHTGGTAEIGNYNTNRQTFTARGGVGKGGLSFSATRLKSGGFFANDDYRNLAASLRYDHPFSDRLNLAFIGRIEDADVGSPGQQVLLYDPNARFTPRNLFGSIQLTNKTAKRRDKIILGAFDRRSRFDDPVNPGAAFPSFTINDLKDRIVLLDAQTTFNRGAHAITLGGELRRMTAQGNTVSSFGNTTFDRGISTRALFVQDEFHTGKFAFAPSVRYEHNSQFGSNLNGRLAGSYTLNEQSRIKSTIGNSFRAPSINELYYPQSGDPNLRPEKSFSYEIGYERDLPRNGRVEVTLFHNRFRDLIGTVATPISPQYPFGFKAGNTARATTKGIELSYEQPFGNGWRAIVHQSFLRTTSSAGRLLRRPKFATSADLIYRRDKWGADIGFVAQGRRFDDDFAAPPFGAGRGPGFYEGFNRFDLTVSYDLRPGLQIFTRVQNLLNKRYEETAGYPAPRFNFVVGLTTRAF